MALVPADGLIAMLLRTDFDRAKTRRHLFGDCVTFAKKLVLTKRMVRGLQWFAVIQSRLVSVGREALRAAHAGLCVSTYCKFRRRRELTNRHQTLQRG